MDAAPDPLPLSPEEIAQLETAWDGSAESVARLIATIRHRDAIIEQIRAALTNVEYMVSVTGQLVLCVRTPMEPRGEQVIVPKKASRDLAVGILSAQGFVQVSPPASAD